MSRLLPLLAFIALAILLFAGVRMNSGRDNSAIPSPLIGKPAPALDLPVLATPQQSITLEQLKGRAFVLNVWGSWCVSCRVEHPVITEMAFWWWATTTKTPAMTRCAGSSSSAIRLH
jgi:cytochrome c biogenesis protein CcmG, thiol:disulfide interchange protein DsbE